MANKSTDQKGQLRALPPEIAVVRDKIVDRFRDSPLPEIAEFVRKVLAQEKNQINRIAALAARLVLIRNYINETIGISTHAVPSSTADDSALEDDATNQTLSLVAEPASSVPAGMQRLKIVEDSSIHGVSFPAGVIIDVKIDDANRLVASNKAQEVASPSGDEASAAEPDPENTTETSIDSAPQEAGEAQGETAEGADDETASDGSQVEADTTSESETASPADDVATNDIGSADPETAGAEPDNADADSVSEEGAETAPQEDQTEEAADQEETTDMDDNAHTPKA